MKSPKGHAATVLPIKVDRLSGASLQEQIQREIVDRIATGALPAGLQLPSSRRLSKDLGVSRNTVAAVYERLIADGHLISRDRSGVYVQGRPLGAEQTVSHISGPNLRAEDIQWRARMSDAGGDAISPPLPPDWDKYPFPFVDGPFDKSLFPVAEWRDASRRALAVSEIESWTRDAGDADDEMLIGELRRKVLPWRGITARPEEVLITTSAQQALHFMAELFLKPGVVVGVEEPCNPELRLMVQRKGVRIEAFDIDAEGMVLDEARLAACDVVFVSPGRQRPTGVTLSQERRAALLAIAARRGQVLIEDDYQWEAGFAASDPMSLRGGPDGANVIYAATLAQPLASAIRLGVLAAPAPVVRAARNLRRMTTRHPALSIQRTFAHMLALGHYASVLRRVEEAFAVRMTALREALNHYLPTRVSMLPASLGTAAWITAPPELEARRLGAAAQERGALIEPVDAYYAGAAPPNAFRLGVSGIEEHRIRDGVAAVARAFSETLSPSVHGPSLDEQNPLGGADIKRACSGATLLCKTVYGDPCTIALSKDGSMSGRAGFANEEHDVGKWWVEGDFWCRQWTEWAYGEVARFRVVIDGERIQWFSADGRLIDAAVIVRRDGKKTT